MTKGYWVVNVDERDAEGYKDYKAFVGPYLAKNQGRYLTRGGRTEIVEGEVHPRVVVIEFPSYEAALEAYHSAEYEAGKQSRLKAGTANFAIVEGYEG